MGRENAVAMAVLPSALNDSLASLENYEKAFPCVTRRYGRYMNGIL